MEKDDQKRTVSEVQQLLKDKTKQIEQHLQALKNEVSSFTPTIRAAINKNPLLTVGGALAAGVVAGMLLSRQRSDPYGRAMMDAYLAPIAATVQARMSTGENAEDAVRAALRGQLPVSAPAPSVSTELVRLLLPVVVGWAAQTLGKSNAGGAVDSDT